VRPAKEKRILIFIHKRGGIFMANKKKFHLEIQKENSFTPERESEKGTRRRK
jgi:hypothetical protein